MARVGHLWIEFLWIECLAEVVSHGEPISGDSMFANIAELLVITFSG